MLSLLVTAKQQRGSPSSRGRATTPVVVSVSGTPAPRRGSTTGATALLAVGQLYSHPTTTQCPIRQADTINLCTLNQDTPAISQSPFGCLPTSHQALAPRQLHLWHLQILQRQSLEDSWPPKHCEGGRSSQTTSLTPSCYHCCPDFQHRPYSQEDSHDA